MRTLPVSNTFFWSEIPFLLIRSSDLLVRSFDRKNLFWLEITYLIVRNTDLKAYKSMFCCG